MATSNTYELFGDETTPEILTAFQKLYDISQKKGMGKRINEKNASRTPQKTLSQKQLITIPPPLILLLSNSSYVVNVVKFSLLFF